MTVANYTASYSAYTRRINWGGGGIASFIFLHTSQRFNKKLHKSPSLSHVLLSMEYFMHQLDIGRTTIEEDI